MVAALPHCDALVSGHSFEALGEVADAIGAPSGDRRAGPPRPPRPRADEPEPWASATPVPGSSVAMPSGNGPSRGNTTPGWVTDDDGQDLHLPGLRAARGAAAPAGRARSPPSATWRSTTR